MRGIKTHFIFIATVVCFFCGCGRNQNAISDVAKSNQNSSEKASTPSLIVFQLVRADGSMQPFSLDDLKKLPLATIFAEGNPQEGPSLLAVLKSSGVMEFQEVAITGREGTKKMTKSEINDEVILDFNNRGSVKLVSPTMPHEARIRDITRIIIK
jgi:hypothetical protein